MSLGGGSPCSAIHEVVFESLGVSMVSAAIAHGVYANRLSLLRALG